MPIKITELLISDGDKKPLCWPPMTVKLIIQQDDVELAMIRGVRWAPGSKEMGMLMMWLILTTVKQREN